VRVGVTHADTAVEQEDPGLRHGFWGAEERGRRGKEEKGREGGGFLRAEGKGLLGVFALVQEDVQQASVGLRLRVLCGCVVCRGLSVAM